MAFPVKKNGFTLIEVLITMVVFLIGMLGLLTLLLKGQAQQFESTQRAQAVSMVNNMAEKIKMNYSAVSSYVTGVSNPVGDGTLYNSLMLGGIVDCGSGACPAGALATYDMAIWDSELLGTKEQNSGNNVGGIINGRGCVESLGGTTYRVSVAWQGNKDTIAPTLLCGANLYTAETKRRVVSVELTL